MSKNTRKRAKVKRGTGQNKRVAQRKKRERLRAELVEFQRRSAAAKLGWQRRKEWEARREQGIRKWREQRPDVGAQVAALETSAKVGKQVLHQLKPEERTPEVVSAAIDRVIGQHISSGEWSDSDETRILGRLFLVQRVRPVQFEEEIRSLADEYDWSYHEICQLWYGYDPDWAAAG